MTGPAVLVTGADRYLGGRLAARLTADDRVARVVTAATDDLLQPAGNGRTRISELLADAQVCTVVHLAIGASASRTGSRGELKERNVIGTMQLLAACQRSPHVRRVVVKSAAAAYGASIRDPAIFTEDTELRAVPRGEYTKDVLDAEGYVRGFSRRRPDVEVTVLRLAPLIGPKADTTMSRYFALPLVPTVLGFDPRVQFLHIDDAVDVLHHATVRPHPEPPERHDRPTVLNVAGPGALPLSQAIRRAGGITLPVPELALSGLTALGSVEFSRDQLDFLRYGRVMDVRRLVDAYGINPLPTPEAFDAVFGAVKEA
ncbi:NAD-dependent epimerase/dehydratase family protein [Phytomonospora endophytica]|uniref:UDP-glucose 4-epimerase n=1 Tax=Phytomonospora endophytica TaxID=714109 RepID=A0A841FG13_9ACTN|nr:NAD-dependent epimerase/dehydratase family protein [Phytomonospora endophytica]MBB6036271.1 UDP-glucose 4-epimerase [Phytomonospora endophytica]GIG67178.1 UDP-glucose 4-epimerase [Phytomonospora endophytica]